MQHVYKSREKVFGAGRPRPMDRNAKARLMTLARALMRRREKGKAYGPVTAKALAVLEALLWGFHNARTGLCFPSLASLAERAECARSTVRGAGAGGCCGQAMATSLRTLGSLPGLLIPKSAQEPRFKFFIQFR
jgi:hypothetical protein